MEKPTPITKEYVEYLQQLPVDEITPLVTAFTQEEKSEIKGIMAEGRVYDKTPKKKWDWNCKFKYKIKLINNVYTSFMAVRRGDKTPFGINYYNFAKFHKRVHIGIFRVSLVFELVDMDLLNNN